MEMPKKLQDWLRSLSPKEADEIWDWIDYSPDIAIDQVRGALATRSISETE